MDGHQRLEMAIKVFKDGRQQFQKAQSDLGGPSSLREYEYKYNILSHTHTQKYVY